MFIVIRRSQLFFVILVLILLILIVFLVRLPKALTASATLPIFQGDSGKKAVAFCINVAWGNEYIKPILDTLKKNECYATFFFTGTWVRDFPDLGRTIAEGGHEIANHGYYHVYPSKLNKADLQKLILDNEKILLKEFGRAEKLFGPPYGEFNSNIVTYAQEIGYKTIMWTIDTIDWKNPSPETLINRVLSKLQNGALILAHPTEVTAKTLQTLITEIKKRGYEILTVSEIL